MAGRASLLVAFVALCTWFSQPCAARRGGENLESVSLRDQQEAAGRPLVTVRAYWMRHGISCANVLKMQAEARGLRVVDKGHGWLFAFYKDPAITNCAIARAKKLGPLIWDKIKQENPDIHFKPIVFSSELIRAMETALYNFPESSVYPIPFIAEFGMSWDNKPRSTWDQQRKEIEEVGTEQAHRVLFWDGLNPEHGRVVSGPDKSNYQLFLKEFPDILGKMMLPVNDGDTIPVIIVGHSGYMRDLLKCDLRTSAEIKANKDKPKPKNNEVWVQEYTTELPDWNGRHPEAHTVTMKAGACRPLFPPQTIPDLPKFMCERDIDRCQTWARPQELLKRAAKECHNLSLCAGEME
eukprot:CAMPEP_0171086862 /NCGR_PEP_ID=MMETSP0766_2-20121228/19801_1 /TAXON_ID=439317 /ORGANISM="Gambierdiscus australes, Strain CAWD 149" /LENGTH=351 /DNA_ID=CAMNT_0011544535 /DNA_START=70 /DNA_END=1125 /DNA_ORIENTATION=-